MCHGPQGHLTCHHVISSSGGTWRAMCTLTNPVIWKSWRMPSDKKCSRSINSCWPERWMVSRGGLKTAFKRMVVTQTMLFFILEYLTGMTCFDLQFCKNKSISSWKSTGYFFKPSDLRRSPCIIKEYRNLFFFENSCWLTSLHRTISIMQNMVQLHEFT